MTRLTLTFDNGPHPDVTPHVLQVLARRSIRSTFFVVGKRLAEPGARALSERAHAEGHWIGNHTWSHSVALGERPDEDVGETEIGPTQALIGDLSHPDRLFRPFGRGGALGSHLLNRAGLEYLERNRFSCVLWNAVPRDWDDPDGWVDTALAQCLSESWAVMVLHDWPFGAMKHLDRFLGRLGDHEVEVRQDFPPDCIPLSRGEIVSPMDAYVS
jgi:peptidoglycan/xylan/chitin deacetylase (PgdA/CDA1 family)